MLCSICNRETSDVTINGSLTLCPACATRLAHAAPAMLRACEQAANLLGRLNTPDAPTWAEVAELRGRLLATVAAARGTTVETETVEESWPDTSGWIAQPRLTMLTEFVNSRGQ